MRTKHPAIFEGQKIRRIWDEDKELWYFSVVDIVQVLTDSVNPTDYLKKLRKRDLELAIYIGTNCPQVEMATEKGKNRKTLAGNTEHLFRILSFPISAVFYQEVFLENSPIFHHLG